MFELPRINKYSKYFNLRSVLSLCIFLLVWQIVSSFGLFNIAYIGQPSLVVSEGFGLLSGGTLLPYIYSSLASIICGFSVALTISIPLGIIFGVNKKLYSYFEPYVYAINSIPKVVILPLILLWFGIGLVPKIIFVSIVASIPILINTIEGVNNVDTKLVEMAKSFELNKWNLYKDVYFFSAWPFIYSGIRIAFGRSVTNLLIAEIYGLGIGLGYLVSLYGGTFQINKLLFIIFLLLIFNFSVLLIFDIVEDKLFQNRKYIRNNGEINV